MPSRRRPSPSTIARVSLESARPNRLLARLGEENLKHLRPHLEPVMLEYKRPLYNAHQRIAYVHFIESGVASVVNPTADGASPEIGMVGNEGIVGVPVVLGDDTAPSSVWMQIPGRALRVRAGVFQEEMERSRPLRMLMLRYAHAFFNQVAQSAACAHVHSLEQRCSCWLLKMHDRVSSDELPITQDCLAMLLGVRRAGITKALGTLRRAGAIGCRRARVRILDRRALQDRACECYAADKAEFDRLLAAAAPAGASDGRNAALAIEIGA